MKQYRKQQATQAAGNKTMTATDQSASASPLAGLGRMIAISSGKGGVGKSTLTANLALALAGAGGLRVGVVDADLYGPSIPGMLGIPGDQPPAMAPNNKVIPAQAHGGQGDLDGDAVGG